KINGPASLFQADGGAARLATERDAMRARIQIMALNSTTFMIGFIYSKPGVTLRVTQDIYDHVIEHLLDVRMRALTNIRDAIQDRAAVLSANLSASGSAPSETQP